MALSPRARTVLLVVLGLLVLGATAAFTLSSLTDWSTDTIAMATLTLCSSVADSIAIVQYLRGGSNLGAKRRERDD